MKDDPDLTLRLWPPTEEQLDFWQDQTGRKDECEKAYAQWLQDKRGDARYEKNAAGGFADSGCPLLNGLLALSAQTVHQYRLIISTPPDPERRLLHNTLNVLREQLTWQELPGFYSWQQTLRDKVSGLLAAPLKYHPRVETRGETDGTQWVMSERRRDHHAWPEGMWKFLSENTRMATASAWLDMFHDYRPDPGRSHLAVMMQTFGDPPQRRQLRMLLGKLDGNIEFQDHYGGIRIATEIGLTWCIYQALPGGAA
jgi:hypothetical protein